jgi:hypothetical protein
VDRADRAIVFPQISWRIVQSRIQKHRTGLRRGPSILGSICWSEMEEKDFRSARQTQRAGSKLSYACENLLVA